MIFPEHSAPTPLKRRWTQAYPPSFCLPPPTQLADAVSLARWAQQLGQQYEDRKWTHQRDSHSWHLWDLIGLFHGWMDTFGHFRLVLCSTYSHFISRFDIWKKSSFSVLLSNQIFCWWTKVRQLNSCGWFSVHNVCMLVQLGGNGTNGFHRWGIRHFRRK